MLVTYQKFGKKILLNHNISAMNQQFVVPHRQTILHRRKKPDKSLTDQKVKMSFFESIRRSNFVLWK